MKLPLIHSESTKKYYSKIKVLKANNEYLNFYNNPKNLKINPSHLRSKKEQPASGLRPTVCPSHTKYKLIYEVESNLVLCN
jgi:hypothetical protein